MLEVAGLDALRAQLEGTVVVPGDDGWDAARQAWNLAVDQRPAAVAIPASAADVAAVVRHAAGQGLRVTAQGSGHGAAALTGQLDRTILLRMERLRGVEVDVGARRARAAAGTLWAEVVEAATPHGLTALHGSAGDVAVVGFTLGGGVGWLARRHGLTCNGVVAFDVVDADGQERRVDAGSDPDLFWALRGGGGCFAIVTAIELELVELPEVYAGQLFWPLERGAEVLRGWVDWCATAPVEATTAFRFLRLPPIPDIPEPFRGGAFAVVDGAILGDAEQAAAVLAPLRELEPAMDNFAMGPAAMLPHIHMDPPNPVPGVGDGALLREIGDETVEALLRVAGPGVETPLLAVELRQFGGALATAPDGAGSLCELDAPFGLWTVGMAMTPEMGAAVAAQVGRLLDETRPWHAERRYTNFADSPGDASAMFDAATFARLREVKGRVDPQDRIQGGRPVAPA